MKRVRKNPTNFILYLMKGGENNKQTLFYSFSIISNKKNIKGGENHETTYSSYS